LSSRELTRATLKRQDVRGADKPQEVLKGRSLRQSSRIWLIDVGGDEEHEKGWPGARVGSSRHYNAFSVVGNVTRRPRPAESKNRRARQQGAGAIHRRDIFCEQSGRRVSLTERTGNRGFSSARLAEQADRARRCCDRRRVERLDFEERQSKWDRS
jgi:hypothetical protein